MTPEFTVSGLRVHNPPIQGTGQALLATAVIEYGALVIIGVSLCRTDSGAYRVWLPRLGESKRIALRSNLADRDRLIDAVRAAYHALSGVPADPPLATALQKVGHQNECT